MKRGLASGIQEIPWLHAQRIDVLYDKDPEVAAHLLQKGSADALVLIHTTYKLTSDFSTLQTSAELNVYPRSDQLKSLTPPQTGIKDSPVPFYKNTVFKTHRLPAHVNDSDLGIIEWTRNQGALIKEAMNQNIEEICNQLIGDLRESYMVR